MSDRHPNQAHGVLLITMPFVGADRPSLGLSLLQAELQRAAVPCTIRYLTFPFASFIGLEAYNWVADDLPYTAFAGEWLFTRDLYGDRPGVEQSYIDRILVDTWNLPDHDVSRLLALRQYCDLFLDYCMETVSWSDYEVIGFTSTFSQNIASLALARRVKEAFPDKVVVFGGANWEGEMGRELHAKFPFVDFVCSGEADHSFIALIEGLGKSVFDASRIPGIVYRHDGASVATGPAAVVDKMDELPVPNYDDFFRDLEESGVAAEIVPHLLVETSRGCWWGAKSHCTFCGLNGGTMRFRSKSPERVIDEIRGLKERYRLDQFEVVDNIIDMSYFGSVLPRLVEEQIDVALFYEVKSNLKREQVRQLAESQVWVIQPGIESLSDSVLKLMGKGTTALQNIQLLKWCQEYGILAEWNLLYGFPGEDASEYEAILPSLHAINFLQPPTGYGPVRLDRFSPYHQNPDGLGMTNVRASAPYRYLYPFDDASLKRTAYYFDYDYADGRTPSDYAAPALHEVERWRQNGGRGRLKLMRTANGSVVLDDSRLGWPHRRLRLQGWKADVYLACDRVRSMKTLTKLGTDKGASSRECAVFLELMVKLGLVLNQDERYLALAVHTPARMKKPTAAVQNATSEASRTDLECSA